MSPSKIWVQVSFWSLLGRVKLIILQHYQEISLGSYYSRGLKIEWEISIPGNKVCLMVFFVIIVYI